MPKVLKRVFEAALAKFAPPELYVRRAYRLRTGKALDLANPKDFSEKIQWLKLFYRSPLLSTLVDKYAVKSYIAACIGSEYCVPTAAVFDKADDIMLSTLPDALALKATHGSGWNIIEKDKTKLDERAVRDYFRFFLRKNYYLYSKEYAYRNVTPRVICEPLLFDDNGDIPMDYKVFCFAGRALFTQVDHDRFTNHTRAFYDRSWNKMKFSIGFPESNVLLPRPLEFDRMVNVSEKLARDLPFVRVDFLLAGNRPYINELTLYPGNGMEKFTHAEWDRKLGDLVELDDLGTSAKGPQ